ncbi:MAG: phosphatase PAP2 family protein, partial [Vicinamibacterales bacterium]
AVAASVAASRVVLGLHWLSDVLVGSLVGALIGSAVFLVLLRS